MKNLISKSPQLNKQIFVLPEPGESLSACSGSNLKHFLVVYRTEDESEELKELLGKILSAVDFDMEKDNLLLKTTSETTYSFIALKSKATIKHVLILGVDPALLGVHFNYSKYVPLRHQDCDFLIADSLAKISEDKVLKTQLWNALKSIFLK